MKRILKNLVALSLAWLCMFSVGCSVENLKEIIPFFPSTGPEIGTEVESELKTSYDMTDLDLNIVIADYNDFYLPQLVGILYFNNYPSKVVATFLDSEVELEAVQVEQDGDYFRMDYNQFLTPFSIDKGTYPIKIYTIERGVKKEYSASFTFSVSEKYFVADAFGTTIMDKESNWTSWV